jgi:hypothetical protein
VRTTHPLYTERPVSSRTCWPKSAAIRNEAPLAIKPTKRKNRFWFLIVTLYSFTSPSRSRQHSKGRKALSRVIPPKSSGWKSSCPMIVSKIEGFTRITSLSAETSKCACSELTSGIELEGPKNASRSSSEVRFWYSAHFQVQVLLVARSSKCTKELDVL